MNNKPQFEDKPDAVGAYAMKNPRTPYTTDSSGFTKLVRGSSRRIMTMRFQPAHV